MYENIDEYFKNIFKLPENPRKSDWESVFNSMTVHTRKRIPSELLLKRRPNEDTKIHDYRIANYRAITYGSMNKALDDLHRIVSGISYTIDVPDNVSEYFNTHVVNQNSTGLHNQVINVKSFIEKLTLKRGIEDPNGFLIWMPSGDGLTDSSTKTIPEPMLVESSQYQYSDKNVFIFLSTEKTNLQHTDGKISNTGELYYFITKTEIWKMYQTGLITDIKWEQEIVYKHNLGVFPIIVLGGDLNACGFYESYFSPYLAFGDEAIHQFSDWQAIMTTSSFPIKEMFGTECRVEKVNKRSNNPTDQEENYSGGGNGDFDLVLTQPDPYGIIKRRIPLTGLHDDSLPTEVPSIRYINPDINIAKYSGESWVALIERAEQSLNIDVTLGLDQSGVAKQIDKEAQYSMITKIGNNFFDNILRSSLKMIDGYLNTITFESSQCSINKPSTFAVKTEAELVSEINSLKTNNAPQFFISEAALELSKKRFSGNPVNERIFDFIALYDPYFTFSTADKSTMLASSILTKNDYIRSVRMFSLVNQIVEEKSREGFMKLSLEQINELFEAKILPFLPEEQSEEFDDLGNAI